VSAQLSADQQRELASDLARFTNDPLGYVLWAFPWGVKGTALEAETGPRQWQREALEEIGAKLVEGGDAGALIQEAIASGHGVGKSAFVAWLVKWGLDTFEDTRGVVTANTEGQLRTKTWPELAKWHRLSLTAALFELTGTALVSLAPGHRETWRIDAVPWSDTNTEAFAGLHNKGKRLLLIFDEASAIADKIWEVAEGALTDELTQIIWAALGNPTRAAGRFRECFRKFRHRWRSRNIDARDVEGTNKEFLAKQVADHGVDSDFIKIRIRGQFPSASVRQYISQTDIDAARGRHLRPEQFNFAAKILTLDNAWEGDDEGVISLRQGLAFRVLHHFAKNDNDVVIAQKLAALEDEHGAHAVFIDGGFGTGVVSVGRTWQRDWTLVWFAGESGDIGCLNKRAEMYKLTRDWLKEGGALPDDEVLCTDLAGPEAVPRLDGKLQIESKKDMKKRGLPSPNRGDSLILSFAFPVLPPGMHVPSGQHAVATGGDYDPYANA
jgi:hypothetical protein